MPKLEYKFVPQDAIKHEIYTVIVQSKCYSESVMGYPRIKFECTEDEFVGILPKFIDFLVDEDQEHFLHTFQESPSRYIEYTKDSDPYTDSNSLLTYKLHSIIFTNKNGQKFEVDGFGKYLN